MYETKYSGFGHGKKIGNQKDAKFAPCSAAPEYQRRGSSDRYPDNKVWGKTQTRVSKQKGYKAVSGGGSKQVSAYYPNKIHGKFESESVSNKLVPPMSGSPKAQ